MKEIWQFLAVIFAGVLVGFLIVFWMVRTEAVDKRFYVYQVLLSPETIETLSNRAIKPKKARPSEFLMDSIRITFLNPETKKWDERTVDIGPYSKFYNEIQNDRGVVEPPESVLESFSSGRTSRIALVVKHWPAFNQEGKTEVFQTLEINPDGDFYRIDLHVDDPQKEWIYFNHPGIESLSLETLKR